MRMPLGGFSNSDRETRDCSSHRGEGADAQDLGSVWKYGS